MNIFVLIVSLLFCVYLCIKRREKYWIRRGFPSAEFKFPCGSLYGIGTQKSLCDGFNDYYNEFKKKGPAVGLFSFTKPLLLLTDPELIKQILITNFENFQDRTIYYNKVDDPISGHLLALQGKEWRERRAMLSPTFTSGRMKIMFEIINNVGDQFLKAVENKLTSKANILEMHELVACFTTDSISNVAFGLDSNSLHNSDSSMRIYGKEILEFSPIGFLKLLFTSSFPELSRKMHLTANKKRVIDFFFNTFKTNIEHREINNLYRKDFLQLLLDLKRKQSLTVAELAAESFIFFLGGFETSNGLITFALYELALNQKIQERLRNEIINVAEQNGGKLSYDMIFELKYLDMVISETLRKYPPAFMILRKSKKDFKIPGSNLTIPKNTDININVYSLQNDSDFFNNPEKFDPERFSPENIRKIIPFTYLPFGSGMRACIGKRYGMMQSKIGLVKLIQHFSFARCEQTSVPIQFLKPTFFLAPSKGMFLSVKRIKN